MRDTNSTHYYKVKFNEAVENYRKIILEVLSDSYKSDLKSLENLRSYTKSLNSFVYSTYSTCILGYVFIKRS